jgi:hypothetical protein
LPSPRVARFYGRQPGPLGLLDLCTHRRCRVETV